MHCYIFIEFLKILIQSMRLALVDLLTKKVRPDFLFLHHYQAPGKCAHKTHEGTFKGWSNAALFWPDNLLGHLLNGGGPLGGNLGLP